MLFSASLKGYSMKLTKEEVLQALRDGRVGYTAFHRDGRVEGPTQIPPEEKKIDHQETFLPVLPELPHIRT